VAVAEVADADVAGESAGTVIARCGMSFSGLVPGDSPLSIFRGLPISILSKIVFGVAE